MQTPNWRQKDRIQSIGGKDFKCFICHKFGHKADACWENKRNKHFHNVDVQENRIYKIVG